MNRQRLIDWTLRSCSLDEIVLVAKKTMASDAIKKKQEKNKNKSKTWEYIQAIGWISTFLVMCKYLNISTTLMSLNLR